MIVVSKRIPVHPEKVFTVLADGWTYAGWVVGASHIRQVDSHWPQVGSRIHHSVGPWPFNVQDVSCVLAVEENKLLELEARMWPMGSAKITLTLTPDTEGGTEVQMAERLARGPLSLLPERVQAAMLAPRNTESLKRLADIAVHRDL
ncbi:SRPBCC family protein [Amycolatopsis thermoflava]|uniref:SRPBCC family protein n=1 Tax=Amycolatopsis thermoflava TaxID=84480 RepID=UPI00380C0777